MGLGFLLGVLVIFHLLLCLSVQANNSSSSSCPDHFECRNLGRMTFPFANFTHPDCGLCMVDCGVQLPLPTIKLNPSFGQLFQVRSSMQSNILKLHDATFESILHKKFGCFLFLYGIFLPQSPSISFSIKSNVTLFRCSKGSQLIPEVVDFFNNNHYRKNESCPDFDLYYRNPKYEYNYSLESRLPPPGCSPFHLPLKPWKNFSEDTDLLQLLTPDFDLKWHLSDRCYRDCHLKGGRCDIDDLKEFDCANAPKGTNKPKKTTKIILVIAIPGVVLLLSFLAIFLVLLIRKKRMNNPLRFLSRKISKYYSKNDLEGGSVYFGVPVFSYAELEHVTNKFAASNELGDGGFGTVYYGKLRDGREVAVKRLYEHNFKRMAQFMNEVEILTRLRHPNLVSLYGCTSRRSRELLLVYEYIPNGTVADHLHGDRAEDQSLTWPVRMNIAIETAGALAYLHASDIIHRDVKTNNILLDVNFQVKVADFGLSRLFPNDVSHVSTAPQGTPGYVDPEYHQCYQLTDKSDVYSFGVLLIELISSMPAVDIGRHRHEINLANLAINRIQKHAFDELIDSSLGYKSDPEVMRMTTSVAELAFRCLQLEKEMRPTMDEVLETLKATRDCNENYGEKTNEDNEDIAESKGKMNSASPESDDVVLLRKHTRFPTSPNSVTDIWVSGSTTNSSSR